MAPLLLDLGTKRQEGPDISARFCCATSLRSRDKKGFAGRRPAGRGGAESSSDLSGLLLFLSLLS